jgi:hypothetical protein
VPVTSSPAQFRSLRAGEIDVALTSPDNVLAYRYNPGNPLGELIDARIVATLDRGMGLGLYGRPGLTAEGLRGARVAVDVPWSGFALALYALADSLGVRRDDYELLAQDRHRSGCRHCSPVTATPPCSTPATSSWPRLRIAPGSPASRILPLPTWARSSRSSAEIASTRRPGWRSVCCRRPQPWWP